MQSDCRLESIAADRVGGVLDGKLVRKRGLEYLKRNRNSQSSHYYFYGHYYAVQAMWHAGGHWWNEWYPWIRDILVKKQTKNGSWSSNYGGEYATAMATIILQMPNDMLLSSPANNR